MYQYKINFKLNMYQKEASKNILASFLNGHDILLDAVCGAGKTEMLLEVISIALQKGFNIGFACPRKQLTIELYERMNEYFINHDKIGLIVGGKQLNPMSNFIFMTTHQLIKYRNYFDLLIIDEIDAFPYNNNIKLENAALLSAKQFIYLSATVPLKYLHNNKLKHITNYKRHHLGDIPNPKVLKVRYGMTFIKLLKCINMLKNDPLIIFVESIEKGKNICKILMLLKYKVYFVYSRNLSSKILDSFRQRDIRILIATTVLERGITLEGLNVIVLNAEKNIFTSDVLIQISGRVGRSSSQPTGLVLLIVNKSSIHIDECLRKIEKYNEMQDL